jgi:aldose sugar dehydrogenase
MRATLRRTFPAVLTAVLCLALLGAGLAAPVGAQTFTDLVPFDTVNGVDHEVVTTAVDDPTSFEIAGDGRLYVAERTGRVKIIDPDGTVVEAGRIGVDSLDRQCADCPGKTLDEGGLHGILLAQDFAETGHVYLYYSVPNSLDVPVDPPKHPDARGPQAEEGKFRLSRFTIAGDQLDLASETPLLENPAEWFHCCHYGGAMKWLADGTLLLTTGDDTISSQSGGFSPHDAREGREYNNADLTSQNPADRRGKILRLNPDGSVPADNPFVDDPSYDPYVYALGFRSPYTLEVEPQSQNLFVGNVGPDAITPDPTRGPYQYDEVETVPAGGATNHGWPRCIADNIAYNQYDWETSQAGPPFDCTDMTPATLYYSYWPSTDFPIMSGGIGSTAMVGAYYDAEGPLALPAGYRRHLVIMDWSRDHLWTVPVTADGTLDTSQTFPLVNGVYGPIHAEVGPDGALYVAEYGRGLYNNADSRITRVTCAGCGAGTPAPTGSADRREPRGVLPVSVPASSAGLAIASVLLGTGLRRRRRTI